MKCSSIKLSSRKEHKQKVIDDDQNFSHFIAEENHSYSFPWIRVKRAEEQKRHEIHLKITNLQLPETVTSFNTGSSLEKWSKKRARLKSSFRVSPRSANEDVYFCYENLDTDLSLLLLNDCNLSDEDNANDNDSLSNLQYEIHTDIEQLLLKSQRYSEHDDSKKRKKKKKLRRLKNNDEEKKRNVKISISRPASPRTEQIIRVDVVASEVRQDSCKNNELMIRRNVIDGTDDGEEICDEEFTVRCNQLSLNYREN